MSKGDGSDAEFIAPHPGAYLQDVLLPRLGVSEDELAEYLELPKYEITALLHDQTPLSVDMAERLGEAFENGRNFWLELQRSYDDWRIERYIEAQRDMIDQSKNAKHCKDAKNGDKQCALEEEPPTLMRRRVA